MSEPDLIVVCCLAFFVVFVLLAFLAVCMRWITVLFPGRAKGVDSALVAAISTSVGTLLPGARVTKIEEESR